MNVFVIGGTGFIGFHIARELISEGRQAGIIALPPIPKNLPFPAVADILNTPTGAWKKHLMKQPKPPIAF